MPGEPPNIEEFNTIAGLIFAQLYEAFPVPIDIDTEGIARAMGVAGDLTSHKMSSGRNFSEIMVQTFCWLNDEQYIRTPSAVYKQVTLTTKGLGAMSAIPSGLKKSVGTELSNAVKEGPQPDLSRISDLAGSFLGGFMKSIGSG
jgi:hypothetical protein